MKRFLSNILLVFGLFAWLLGSCDIIDEPYLREGMSPVPDTAACPVPEFPALSTPVQHVLLEDYTGHKCPNCPAAAVLAHDLYQQWGGRLKVVAIHAGWFATFGSAPYLADFTTPAGNTWDQFFGVSNVGNPNGLINRGGYSQTHIVSPSNWAGRIQSEMQLNPDIMLQVINDYDPNLRKLCVHVRTSWIQDLQLPLNLVVMLTEDSIVSPQKNNSAQVGPVPDILDYNHMHILRHVLSGAWGRPLTSGDTLVLTGTQHIQTFRYDIPETIVPRHCKVIAFAYSTSDYRILQVEDAAVMVP